MGRVLISISLMPNDKPILGLQNVGPFAEPASAKFVLRLDTYEVNGPDDFGKLI
jgi:hypothetical protein